MSQPGVVLQLEPIGGERLYLELGPRELEGLAASLAHVLRAAGVGRGHRLLVYDFSTSLSTLALTRAYAPGLPAGACEELGCSVLSLDGLPALAPRTAFFYRMMEPEALMVRQDLLDPLRARLGSGGLESNPRLRSLLIVSREDASPPPAVGPRGAFRLYSCDPALFLALVDPAGRAHYDRDLYDVACEDGYLSVRPRFAPGLGPSRTLLSCSRAEVSAA